MTHTIVSRNRPWEEHPMGIPELNPRPNAAFRSFERITLSAPDPSISMIQSLRTQIPPPVRQLIPSSVENFTFDKASAPGLQQVKPMSKQPMCKHMGDADSCKDGDAGAVKSEVFNRTWYTSNSFALPEEDKELATIVPKLLTSFSQFQPTRFPLPAPLFSNTNSTAPLQQFYQTDAENKIVNNMDADSTNHFQMGKELCYRKNYDDAIDSLKKVQKETPEFNDAQYLIGYSYYQKKACLDAIQYLKHVPTAHPYYEYSQEYLGHCHYEMKDYNSASQYFSQLTNSYGNYMYTQYCLGLCYYCQKRYYDALSPFLKVRYCKVYYYDSAKLLLGKCYFSQGARAVAKEQLSQVNEHSTYFAEAQELIERCDEFNMLEETTERQSVFNSRPSVDH
jgi:TolA-binding protein